MAEGTRKASLGRRHGRGTLGEWHIGRTRFLASRDEIQKAQPKMAMSLAYDREERGDR